MPSSITTLEALTIDEVPYILGSFINLADLPDSNISSSDVDPIEDEYFGKNFSVEPSIGLARSFYFNKVKDYEFLNDRPGYGFDFQVLGGMSLSEKLTINTGLRYVNYTWGSNVGQSREAERDSFNGSPGYVIEPNSSYESGALLETVSYLKYLSVPTTLNYIILDNKLKVTLGLGLSTDWLISANVIEYYPGFESYVGVSSNTKEVNATNGFIGSSVSQPDNSDLLRKFSLSYHIQAPIYYELKENIHLVATPYGNLQGSNFITSSYSQRKAYNYGLRLGVKLDL